MKILLPTDFSDIAHEAFVCACSMSKMINATLTLYHSADLPDDWEDLSVELKFKDSVNKAIALRARDKLIALQKEAESMGVTCDYIYTGGAFLKNIKEALATNEYNLVVMGSHGSGGKREWLIGSNTQKIVRHENISVLVIKERPGEPLFKRVAFASNLMESDQKIFKTFLDFIRPFKPEELHVVSIDTAAWFSQPTILMHAAIEDFKAIAKGYDCKTHFYKDYSIDSGIRHFVDEHNIDLIGISNQSKNPIKRFFQGSNVEMLVNHCEAAVLSLEI